MMACFMCRISVTLPASHTNCQWLSEVGFVTCCDGKLLSYDMLLWSTQIQIEALYDASNIVSDVVIGWWTGTINLHRQHTVWHRWGIASGQNVVRTDCWQNVCCNVVNSTTVLWTVLLTCEFKDMILNTGYHLIFLLDIRLKHEW